MFSDKVKSVRQSRGDAVSARIAFPLPRVEHNYAALIELERWLGLRIDRRAPVRSVVFVEVFGERFLALVIDTLAARPRWLVEGVRSRLSQLYDGVLGPDGRARGALVISAPDLVRSLTPVHVHREVLDVVIGFSQEECDPPLRVAYECDPPMLLAAVSSPTPSGGSPGVTVAPSLVVQAQLLSDAANGLSDATEVQITDAQGGTQSALLVAPSTLL
jgi:hypothetical protein